MPGDKDLQRHRELLAVEIREAEASRLTPAIRLAIKLGHYDAQVRKRAAELGMVEP